MNNMNNINDMNFFSKKYLMKTFLGWTDKEIEENERRWKEENPPKPRHYYE